MYELSHGEASAKTVYRVARINMKQRPRDAFILITVAVIIEEQNHTHLLLLLLKNLQGRTSCMFPLLMRSIQPAVSRTK